MHGQLGNLRAVRQLLGAARNGAISGGLRRNQRSQGRRSRPAVQVHGRGRGTTFYSQFLYFLFAGGSGLRYDPILRQLLMLP